MGATSSPSNTRLSKLITEVKSDYPEIKFIASDTFRWSSEDRVVFYDANAEVAEWSLLHEVGHMLKLHRKYSSDAMLVRMEVEAWDSAKELASKYGLEIDEDYVQDCIDSYRNWQHMRSTCPTCTQTGVETANGQYRCINCRQTWKVTPNRFCRVYRKTKK